MHVRGQGCNHLRLESRALLEAVDALRRLFERGDVLLDEARRACSGVTWGPTRRRVRLGGYSAVGAGFEVQKRLGGY